MPVLRISTWQRYDVTCSLTTSEKTRAAANRSLRPTWLHSYHVEQRLWIVPRQTQNECLMITWYMCIPFKWSLFFEFSNHSRGRQGINHNKPFQGMTGNDHILIRIPWLKRTVRHSKSFPTFCCRGFSTMNQAYSSIPWAPVQWFEKSSEIPWEWWKMSMKTHDLNSLLNHG